MTEAAYRRHRRYYEANKEKVKARAAKWAKDNDYKKPKEGNRRRAQRYRERHGDRRRAYLRKLWQNDPRYRIRHANKEARRRAAKAGSQTEAIDRIAILQAHGELCGICGKAVDPSNFHLDHRIPLSKNGTHTSDNVQPAHPTCNLKKGGKVQ